MILGDPIGYTMKVVTSHDKYIATKHVTGFAKIRHNVARTEIHFIA